MAEGKIPYLTGCVLYLLLREAVLPDANSRHHRAGIKDEHKNPRFMADLVYTFTGVDMPESESDTSRYRNGKKEGTINVPFNDQATIDEYDVTVRTRYTDALNRMCDFTNWHLNPEKREWFVKACLDIVDHDDSISETDEFCLKSDGSFLSKASLREESEFEFQPFILGMLHYVLLNRAGKNYLGIPTLDAISEQDTRKQRKYKGTLGSNIKRTIKVTMYEEKTDSVSVESQEDISDTEFDESVSNMMENTVYEKDRSAEDIAWDNTENQSCSEESSPGTDKTADEEDREHHDTTVIKQQTNVIQNGEHNVNVTNNGTMNFNF